jgi:hypothetical protein
MSRIMSPEKQRLPRSDRPIPPVACVIGLLIVIVLPLYAANWDVRAFQPGADSVARTKLQIWLTTIGGQGLVWAFLLFWMTPHLARLVRSVGWRPAIVHAVLPTAILCVPWLFLLQAARRGRPAVISGIEIQAFTVGHIGLLVVAVCLCVLFLEYCETMRDARGNAADRVARLGAGLSRIHHSLFAAAIVLGLGTIGAGALRTAIEAEKPGTMPTEHVALYGIVGSLFLLVAYAPVRLEFYRRGERAIAEACDAIPQNPDAIEKWAAQRAAMESLLGHDPKSFFGLGGVVSSLLPLVLGSIGKLLEK